MKEVEAKGRLEQLLRLLPMCAGTREGALQMLPQLIQAEGGS